MRIQIVKNTAATSWFFHSFAYNAAQISDTYTSINGREHYKMNPPKKFKIHIKLRAQEDRVVKEETVYLYRWDRIIGTCAVVIIAIAALINFGLNDSKLQSIDSEQPTAAIAQPMDKSISSVTYKAESITTQPTSEAAIKSTNASKEKNIEITAKTQSTTTARPNTAPTALFTQSRTAIFSPHIKRFVISKTVRNKEPVGSIKDIHFDHNNIATVYAYSDAIGLKDETLYYHWSLDGKAVAKVKVSVWSNRWRSYSSKFIRPNMQGEWKITLQNGKGETLAVNRFRY